MAALIVQSNVDVAGEHNNLVHRVKASTMARLLAEVKTISIPRIHCSFPCSAHPDSERLKEESRAWIVARFALLPSVRGSFTVDALTHSGFDLLTTLTYANGQPCRIMSVLKYIAWLFMFDTVLDDPLLVGANPSAAQALSSAISSVLDDVSSTSQSGHGDDPIIRAMTDTTREWWLEIRQGMPSRLQARFVAAVKDYLKASQRQIQFRNSGCIPDFHTFLRIRADAGAWHTCAMLIEYSLEIDFEEETVAHPLFVAVNAVAADHIDWVNDLVSFKKELMEDDLLNLVAVTYELNLGKEVALQGAVDEVCDMIRERDQECVRIMAEIKASQLLMSKAGMAGYLEGVGNWMRGSLEWHMVSGRYK